MRAIARILTKDDKKIIYLHPREKSYENLFCLQHALRIKQVLYGCLFHTYHPDMDFKNAIEAGWKEDPL